MAVNIISAMLLSGGHAPQRDHDHHHEQPSLLSIAATYVALRLTQRDALRQPIAANIEIPPYPPRGLSPPGNSP